ncbi:hypothetical protein HK096_011536, partial [Nowakowskiella sp. JEL0078]
MAIHPFIYDYVAIAALFGINNLLNANLKPFHRPFRLDDPDLSHPHLKSFVPSYAIFVFGLALPVTLAASYLFASLVFKRLFPNVNKNEPEREGLLSGTTSNTDESQNDAEGSHVPNSTKANAEQARSLYIEFHRVATAIAIAIALAMLTTDVIKNFAGRLRPDFLSRCEFVPYDPASLNANAWVFEGRDGVCEGKKSLVADGRKSFPSAHSSESFAGVVVFALWILRSAGLIGGARGINVRDRDGVVSGVRVLVAGALFVSALFVPAYIAIS